MLRVVLSDDPQSVNWDDLPPLLDLEIKTSHKSTLQGGLVLGERKLPRRPKRITHSGIGFRPGLEESIQERYRCKLLDFEVGSKEEDMAAYSIYLTRSQRISLAGSRSARTRNASKLKLSVLLGATREDNTYCYVDLNTIVLGLHTSTGYPPSKKQKTKRGRRKSTNDLFKWHSLDHEGHQIFSAQFDYHHQTRLSSADSILLSSGFVLHKDKFAWYATKADARRALVVNILTHVASKREPKKDPNWITCKLKEEMKGTVDQDFCVLYESGGGDRNDLIFGVLFFRGDDRIFLVPNVVNEYDGGWTDFNFRDIRSRFKN